MDFIKHPKTIVSLSDEIKKACDAYWDREISDEELREILLYWSDKEKDKLFVDNEYRPLIVRLIGKRRRDLLDTILKDF